MDRCRAVFALVLAAVFSVAAAQPKSASEIGDYHIILWTSILLALILLGIIYFMLGMDSKKDPALYAQVVDPRQSAVKKQS
jgi:hypothetical protein